MSVTKRVSHSIPVVVFPVVTAQLLLIVKNVVKQSLAVHAALFAAVCFANMHNSTISPMLKFLRIV